MTLSQRAVEAAARACYEHEPLERDDFVEIPWDELGQGTRDRFMHKARSTLTAALAVDGLCLVQGWQPIETAPKDGTPVLLAGGEDDNVTWAGDSEISKMKSPCRAWWADGTGWVITLAEAGYVVVCRDSPTHWMPLPAPPPAASDVEDPK